MSSLFFCGSTYDHYLFVNMPVSSKRLLLHLNPGFLQPVRTLRYPARLFILFEVQGYASMLLGGALPFNLIFPSNEPDIWRLMGMWSIWMFTIPSRLAQDCSKNEKEALNYLFLLIPLLNVLILFFLKSFAVVWSADTISFFLMYAWKLAASMQI